MSRDMGRTPNPSGWLALVALGAAWAWPGAINATAAATITTAIQATSQTGQTTPDQTTPPAASGKTAKPKATKTKTTKTKKPKRPSRSARKAAAKASTANAKTAAASAAAASEPTASRASNAYRDTTRTPATTSPTTNPSVQVVKPAPAASAAAMHAASAPGASDAAGDSANNAALESVLDDMDTAAASFKSAEAEFVWEQYQKVVDEKDIQKGRIYFRRAGKETQMSADVESPEKKQILFADGKIRLYQPNIEQVTEKEVGNNRAEMESFLVLGFGGRGHDLPKSFTVKYLGKESVDGVETAKLDLVPRAPRVRNIFDHITLWIDARRGISLQQQAFESSGDYRIARYRNIKLNQKINDDAFKLKTTSKTRTIKP